MNEFPPSVNVLIGGEAGQGLVTIGQLLAESLVRAGFHITVTQSYQSRIRGGHNTFAVRGGTERVAAPRERYDVLVALNGETVALHRDEVADAGLIIVDEKENLPGKASSDRRCIRVPFEELAPKRYLNSASLGVAAHLVGLEEELVAETLGAAFGNKDAAVRGDNRETIRKAYAWCRAQHPEIDAFLPPRGPLSGRVMMHGNEAIALGAISAGIGMYAYYPMTPGTSIATGIIQYKEEKGTGPLIEQAEDEIAAINMAIGASFVGTPAMVGTSGGGFALMAEGVSLAAMTETPVVVAVAQRPGPATGLPTRTEQGDLEMVLHAGHGEFPRAVYAPGSVEECFRLTRIAVEIAEQAQGPTFILTDQFLADSFRSVPPLVPEEHPPGVPPGEGEGPVVTPYRRYALTDTGLSPRLIPGRTPHLVIADSDEHGEDGHLTEDLSLRPRMVEKRLAKEGIIRGRAVPPVFRGPRPADILFVCWGSSRGPVNEAADDLNARGTRAAVLAFSQVWPLVPEQFVDVFDAADRIVCVEGNATAQFTRLLRRETGVEIGERILRYDGLPFTPEYILRALDGRD